MIDREQLIADLDASTLSFLATIENISDENFNRRSGSEWSVGDITEHLVLLDKKINEVFADAHTSKREAHLKIEPMRLALESNETKFAAPVFLVPSTEEKKKDDVVKEWTFQRELLKQKIRSADLAATVDHKHPYAGSLTRLEWIHLDINHCIRHREQIKSRMNTW